MYYKADFSPLKIKLLLKIKILKIVLSFLKLYVNKKSLKECIITLWLTIVSCRIFFKHFHALIYTTILFSCYILILYLFFSRKANNNISVTDLSSEGDRNIPNPCRTFEEAFEHYRMYLITVRFVSHILCIWLIDGLIGLVLNANYAFDVHKYKNKK